MPRRRRAILISFGVVLAIVAGIVGSAVVSPDFAISLDRSALVLILVALLILAGLVSAVEWLISHSESGRTDLTTDPSLLDESVPREPRLPIQNPNRPDRCYGRDVEVAELVEHLVARDNILVSGPPGIGKSTIIREALTSREVQEVFGDRVIVVSCHGFRTAVQIWERLAQGLGLSGSLQLIERVIAFVQDDPTAIGIDNFETISHSDKTGAVDLLDRLAQVPTVSLVVGHQGLSLPFPVNREMQSLEVSRLKVHSIDRILHDNSDSRSLVGSDLDEARSLCDGFPLAAKMIGKALGHGVSVSTLVSASREPGYGPFSDDPALASISWPWLIGFELNRLDREAKDVLSIAALIPDGWPVNRHRLYLDTGSAGITQLTSVHALLDTQGGRQICRQPIKSYVARAIPPEARAYRRLLEKVEDLSSQGNVVGMSGGSDAAKLLKSEYDNIVGVSMQAIAKGIDVPVDIRSIGNFQRFIGVGDYEFLSEVSRVDDLRCRALALESLGLLAIIRLDFVIASESLADAEQAFLDLDDSTGLGRARYGLAILNTVQDDPLSAARYLRQSMSNFAETDDEQGLVDCMVQFAVLEHSQGNTADAHEIYARTRSKAQEAGNLRCEAICLLNSGLIYLDGDDPLAKVRSHMWKAIPKFEESGIPGGVARCYYNLATLDCLPRREYVAYRKTLKQARAYAKLGGEPVFEAQIMLRLAEVEQLLVDLSHEDGSQTEALSWFQKAARLCRALGRSDWENYCEARLEMIGVAVELSP